MDNYEFELRVAKSHLVKKLLPALALSTGLSGCGPYEQPTVVDTPSLTQPRRVRNVRTPFDNAIKEVQPEIDKLVAQYPDSFDNARAVYLKRAWYSIRFTELMDPYYDMFDNLSESQKKLYLAKFTELEQHVAKELNMVYKRLSEDHLKFKPWQRPRFEKIER